MTKQDKATRDNGFSSWEECYAEEGIDLNVRKHRKSGLYETKVATSLAATTDAVWKALVTPDSYCRLMPKTAESIHIEEHPRKKEAICYQRIKGGATADRDYTLAISWTKKKLKAGNVYHRQWHVANNLGPEEKEGVVRVEVNDGSWHLEPLASGKCKFTQENYIELGGSLWKLLANTGVKDAARELAEKLREEFGAA